jgi:hypothetical protein
MLRPNKGEGERPKHIRKAPQITVAVLLAAYPICMAEQAQATYASASAFGESTGLSQQPPLTASQRLFQSGNSVGLNTGKIPFLNPFNLTKEEYQTEVQKATNTLNSAKKDLATAQNRLDTLTTAKNKAQSALDAAKTAFDSATSRLDTLKASTDSTATDLADAKSALDTATNNLTSAEQALQSADEVLNRQMTTNQSAHDALNTAHANLTTASANLQSAQTAYNLASTNLSNSLSALQSAQSAYTNSSIPNPNYVAPTPTYVPVSYQIPDNNFTTGANWIGDGTAAGQPQIHSGHLHYSYVATEVYQDILISPRAIANYTFTVNVWNQDQNTVGYTGLTPDTYGLRIYFYDANNNIIHQDSYTSNAIHSWQDVVLQGNTNTNAQVSKVRIAIYGIDNGYWQGTYGPAMNNVRLLLGWTTGSTQAATTTGTMNVDINEGGQATFTAPNGGVFISSNLRYEAIDDPSCGTNVSPQLGSNTVTLAADNGVWGDPCGGWYKHLVGTLTYSTAEPQFIKDPALYTALQTAQSNYDSAQSAYDTAQSSLQQAQDDESSAQSSVDDANSYVTDSQTALLNFQSSKDSAVAEVNNLKSIRDAAQSAYEAEQKKFRDSQVEFSKAQTDYETSQSQYEIAQDNFAKSETDFNSASVNVEKATNDVEDAQQALDNIPQPDPEPEKPVAPEIPKGDPKDLSTEEVAQLVTQAEAVLETAEQGSAQYEQALEALAVAADADDPEISAELAAIPLLGDAAGAALEVLNNLGNVGADMAPAVREEAEKTVIASVIATGAAVNAVQAAAGAAAAAATTTSTSTSGSSSGGGGGGASGSSDSKPTRSTRKAK